MNIIQLNKKVHHDYYILEKLEAGIILKGSEVKSIRKSKINLKGSFCKFFNNELFLFDCNISKYNHQNIFDNFSETRDRKLLINKNQIKKWQKELQLNQGYSIVPLKVYFNDKNKCKLEIALVKGKKEYDKRHVQKEKDIQKKLNKKDYN